MDSMEDTLSRSLAAASEMLARGAAYSSVLLSPPGVYNRQLENCIDTAATSSYPKQKLVDWVRLHGVGGLGDIAELRRYHERCVHILHSLVLKVIVTVMKDKADMQLELAVHPRLISINNIINRLRRVKLLT
jgi:hypothetical protein